MPFEPAALEFLREFLATPAPARHEAPAAAAFEAYASGFADVSSDEAGNRFARRGSGAGPRIALCGHLDEIGLVVTGIEEAGFLRFETIGSWDPSVLVGQRVLVRGRDGIVSGVVGRAGIHVLRAANEQHAAPKPADLWIDIAVEDGAAARELVEVGSPVVLAGEPAFVRGHLLSRSLDNRLGTFAVLEALRALPEDLPGEVVVVATLQEEVGGAGALAAGPELGADAVIVVDLSPASDTPAGHPVHTLELRGGPGLNSGTSNDAAIVAELQAAAERIGIRTQLRTITNRTSTDADRFTKTGLATALVSIPARYAHTPSELVALQDVRQVVDLLVAWVTERCGAA